MKILIFGGRGMLGSECKRIFSQQHEVISPDKEEVDITSWDGVIETLHKLSPDVVINCAGLTDVNACETQGFAVRKINVEGPRNLAQSCARFERKLVHISSEHVFSGQKPIPQPYFEDDTVKPLSAYGRSKMESEVAVRDNSPNYIIIRTAWLYGINGENFVKSIVNRAIRKKPLILRVPDDRFGSPTWSYRLAVQIRELIDNDGRGTYHATTEGYCSRFECARYIIKKLGLKTSLEPVSMKDLNEKAASPVNCLLENRRLKAQDLNIMPNWKKDMRVFLEKCGEDLIKEAETQKF